MDLNQDLHFDGWTLHRRSGELVRGDTRVRLQEQPLQVLVALLERPGELVRREELIARLWPKGVVDFDTALNSAVHRLRVALADHADTPRLIETVPRRGYRFIGSLDVACAAPVAVATVAPPVAADDGPPRIGRWRRLSWVAAALTLVLATLLWIVPRADRGATAGGAPTGAPAQPAAMREAVERGQFFLARRDPGDLELARRYFEKAIALDAGVARAWSGLASVYWLLTVHGEIPPERGLAALRDAAERALTLDPSLAEAHIRLANYRMAIGDRQRAVEHIRNAGMIEPDNPLVLSFKASDALQEGRWQEAVELQRRAVAAAPLSQSTRYNLAWMLFVTGQLEEAESELMAISELSPRAGSADLLGFVRIRSGRPAAALDTCTADTPDGLQCRAMAHYALGDLAEAEAAMRELIETRGQQDPLRVAETYAYFGETEAAFQWLQKGGAGFAATPWGTPSHVVRPFAMRVSPFSTSLNKDRRWSEWLESQQQPQAAQTSKRG